MKEEWNPRYVLYAKYHGKSPEEMLNQDKIRCPGGCMAGFIIWIQKKWREFDSLHPDFKCGDGHTTEGHRAFDRWLTDGVTP